jgi:hypothetical protein
MEMHISPSRFPEVASGDSTLSTTELNHMENCPECLDGLANEVREMVSQRKEQKVQNEQRVR